MMSTPLPPAATVTGRKPQDTIKSANKIASEWQQELQGKTKKKKSKKLKATRKRMRMQTLQKIFNNKQEEESSGRVDGKRRAWLQRGNECECEQMQTTKKAK